MTSQIRKNILDTLLNAKHVLITAHKSPDGDSLGSQLALAGFLENNNIPCMIVDEGEIPDKYSFLPNIESVKNAENTAKPDIPFDVVVVVECSNLERIGLVQNFIDEGATIINIDHHQDNCEFGQINLKECNAAAAGEMIYNIIRSGSHEITRDMAVNMYTAILTDTGRFHYSSTTSDCLKVAADLIDLGVDTVDVTEKVYYNMRPQVIRLTGMVIAAMQFQMNGRLCLLTVDKKTMKAAGAGRGDTEGLVNYAMYSNGVELGVMFTEMDNGSTKVSLRSINGVDVASIAAHFGGGGHVNASGCVVEMPLDNARETVVNYIRESLDGSV